MASAAEQLAANLNFSAFSKAEELKKRIWFTLGALLVYRLGTYIPLPGINIEALTQAFQQQSQGILGMFNMFAGGAVPKDKLTIEVTGASRPAIAAVEKAGGTVKVAQSAPPSGDTA